MKKFLTLSPVLVFMAVYLISAAVIKDFYKIPISAAFMIACGYAFLIFPGGLKENVTCFSSGAGDRNVLLMIWIFILAGAFAATAKQAGAIEAMVNLTLSVIPGGFLLGGLFIASCIVSFAVGTSVGTIVAIMPLASGIATETGMDMATTAAAVVGGAFFGDNLSFISDTTIASTQALGCELRDKFRANIKIVAPAVLIVLVIYLFIGRGNEGNFSHGGIDVLKLIPYLSVIIMAFCRIHVLCILAVGLVLNLCTGLLSGSIGWTSWMVACGEGIYGMGELIIITLLAGGLLALIRKNGGLDYLASALTYRLKGPRAAEFAIAALVSLANICTANNTIAIITCGGIAKDLCGRFNLKPRKVASIMDTFSCLVQGILPYGAQLLMAASLAGISAAAIIPKLYYPFVLGICAILGILIGKAGHGTDPSASQRSL